MILSKKIIVKNNKYYKDIGYDINPKFIEIDINDLPHGSHNKILAKCDYCGQEKEISYKEYNKNIIINGKFSCSVKCGSLKSKETSLLKYGVESVNQLEDKKKKAKKTVQEKWGVDHISKLESVKESKSNIMKSLDVSNRVKKYWNELNPDQIEGINEKRKKTVSEKYGVDFISQLPNIKEQIKKTNLEKWGGFTYQSNTLMQKVISTNLDKYGCTYSINSDVIREKIKQTNLEKWGVEYPSQNEIIKNKIKQTTRENWGVDNIMFVDSIVSCLKLKFYNKWGTDSYFKTDEFKLNNRGKILQNENWRLLNLKISKDENYIRYIDNYQSEFKCDCDGDHNFIISSSNYYNRLRSNTHLCTVCFPISQNSSNGELELKNYIMSIYNDEIIPHYRDEFEIDIYLPKIKIGFEFNGLYWHSNLYKDKNYHLNKTTYFKEKGIRIIHIWEDDWAYKQNIIKSQINHWLGVTENRIFARKCEIREINNTKLYRNFLDNNHIQGYVRSIIKIGLFFENELVSLMTFDNLEGRKKMEDNSWNISRFCNKLNTNVIGASSKLLNYFIKNYTPNRLISFADLDWSLGDVYYKLGFELNRILKPDYKYIIDDKRVNKQRFTKRKLCKIDIEQRSESMITTEMGINKIYNVGWLKFELLNN